MHTMPHDEEAVSPAEFSRETGLSLTHTYRLLWSGKLQAIKHDGQWAIPAAEVERRKQQRVSA